MRLFLLLILVLMPLVQANLIDYPSFFYNNGVLDVKLVIGDSAKAEDTLSAIDISTSLQTDGNGVKAVLASTIDDPLKENLIVVGGACVNSVAAWLMDFPLPCTEGIPANSGIIQLFTFGTFKSLLVAGETAFETMAASKILVDKRLIDSTLMIVEPLAKRETIVSS